MPDVTLTPSQVYVFTGVHVSTDDIEIGGNVIHSETGHTVTEHRDGRSIPEVNVRKAWAIVSVRIAEQTLHDPADAITSESQDDYSYSKDSGQASKLMVYPNILAGQPALLLNWAPSFTARAREPLPAHAGYTRPPVTDDYGIIHPRSR